MSCSYDICVSHSAASVNIMRSVGDCLCISLSALPSAYRAPVRVACRQHDGGVLDPPLEGCQPAVCETMIGAHDDLLHCGC